MIQKHNNNVQINQSQTYGGQERRVRPFGVLEIFLAWRYLRARGKGFVSIVVWFSFAGIVLGVMTLIIVTSVMNGFRDELLEKITGMNGQITLYTPQAEDAENSVFDKSTFTKILNDVRLTGGIVLAFPYTQGNALASSIQGGSAGVLVRGMRFSDVMRVPAFKHASIQGAWKKSFQKLRGVLVGKGLARNLNLMPGSFITLFSPRGRATPFGVVPNVQNYTVAGIFDVGMFQYNQSMIVMPLVLANQLFSVSNTAKEIGIFGQSPNQAPFLKKAIQRTITPFHCCSLVTWQEANKTFFQAVKVERNMMFLILTLILLVASFNIISGLTMLVNDKTRVIAVLRTIGATRWSIVRIFFIIGASIGCIGTFIGTICGILFCFYIDQIRMFFSHMLGTTIFSPEVYFLSHMPAHVDLLSVSLISSMSLLLAFLSTLYPAFKAASLDPATSLRSEV